MKRLFYILITTLLLVSCTGTRSYFPDNTPPADIHIIRFDRSFLQLDVFPDSITPMDAIEELYDEYPDFMPFWVEEILGIPVEDTTYLRRVIPQFLHDTTYGFHTTNAKCAETFADITSIQKELNTAFGRLSTFYPTELPEIYFFISGFNRALSGTPDGNIAVGIDMYLGSDYEYYNRVVYDYQKQTMRKECIPVDIMTYFLFTHIPFASEKSRLLENMIYRGKIMFITSLLFPGEEPWEVAGYTRQQWQWCINNERAIWGLIMDKKDLYKTDPLVLTSYLNDGPFTSEVSQQSPGRLGMWVGWRIVQSYMEHNPQVTLKQLLANNDAQLILEQSKYKP